MKWIVGIVVIAALGVIGWFLVSPAFIDESVEEPFGYTTAEGYVDLDKVMAMPETERAAMRPDIMATAAAAPDRNIAETQPPSTTATVLKIGMFQDADEVHQGRGAATLYALSDGRHVLRFENFRTTNGPDLVVYLSKHEAPASAADVTEAGYVSLGALKGNVGNQNYDLPDDIDLAEYQSVVIWCELFGVLFSPARLIDVS